MARSEDDDDEEEEELTKVVSANLFAIKSVSSGPKLDWKNYNDKQGYDGVLGLSPFNPQATDYWSTTNVVAKLSRDHYIGQPLFSIFVSLK